MGFKNWRISVLAGLALIVFYLTCTIIAIILYPGGINPLNEYVSYLGDYIRNPTGAGWYNAGCILGGFSIIIFVLTFGIWITDNRIQHILVIIAQIIGVCDGIMLILVGIFEQGHYLHGTASSLFFFTNLGFFIFSIASFFPNPKFIKGIGIFGLVATLFNTSYLFGLHEIFNIPNALVEWITVFTALGYILLLVFNIYVRLK